jgi:hypothetical protein
MEAAVSWEVGPTWPNAPHRIDAPIPTSTHRAASSYTRPDVRRSGERSSAAWTAKPSTTTVHWMTKFHWAMT